MVFRTGGDEFAVVCPETEISGASQLAEKIRKTIELRSAAGWIACTVSLGVAEYQSGISPKEFYHQADQALYAAKNSGRNRVEAWN